MKLKIIITADTSYDNMFTGKSIKEISEEFRKETDPGIELISIEEIAPAKTEEAQVQPTTEQSTPLKCNIPECNRPVAIAYCEHHYDLME